MAARSLADRLLLVIPLLLAAILMLFAAVPWHLGISLAPQVLWLMTLTVGVAYPPAWPPALAFILGLAADTLSGTPLGSQALLALLMALAVRAQSRRLDHQMFRVRWMEATGALLVLNLAMWASSSWVTKLQLPMVPVLRAVLVSSLWFPIFYVMVEQVVKLLPPRS
jgi:rod shape-determining protein MreD